MAPRAHVLPFGPGRLDRAIAEKDTCRRPAGVTDPESLALSCLASGDAASSST
jgi:hypothetical protein